MTDPLGTSPPRKAHNGLPEGLRLSLLLAGPAAAREAAAEQVRALAGQADLGGAAALFDAQRMLPLLGTRLLAVAGESLPATFAERVERRLLMHRAANLAREVQLRGVLAALAERGIAALPLKGVGLAQRVHGDIGLRSPGDIDLLVAAGELAAAVVGLRAAGYAEPADEVDRRGLPRLHFELDHPKLATVELHWRISWYEERFAADMLERAEPGDDGVLVPDPVDEAASLLLYFARDGFVGLRAAADIAAWWDRCGDGRSRLLGEHLERYPELAPSWRAAAAALAAFTGIPASTWVDVEAPAGLREHLAVRLACWSQRGDVDQLQANISLVDGLLTPAPTLDRFLVRALRNEHIVPHIAKTTARFAAALWAVRREPWDPVPPDVPVAPEAS